MLVNIHTHTLFEAENTLSIQNILIPSDVTELETWELPAEEGTFSVGIHPWHCTTESMALQLAKLEEVAQDNRVKAIGECGLDALCATPRLLQEEIFRKQIRLAENLEKPVIIHCVKAFDALIGIQKVLRPSVPLVIHGFAKHKLVAEQLLKRGFYLSMGQKLHPSWDEAFYMQWKEQFFVETDTLEDVSIATVYQQVAQKFGINKKEVEDTIEENYWFITAKK
ncbi:MAG: TatD family hydrolase [Spirosomataceae bacterium]